MNRILVIRGGAIGDFILTLPALKLLRDRFPQARIEILGYQHIIALAENRFYADAIRSIEYGPLASFFASGADLPPDLADYFHSFDLVISYLFDPDRIFERNVTRCGVENFIAANPKAVGDGHAALQLARPLRQLGLPLSAAAARLYPSDDDRAAASILLGGLRAPIVALHPGSGSVKKNWPIENWQAIAQRSLDDGTAGSLVIVGGEADQTALRALRSTLAGTGVCFCEDLPLPVLAAALQRCALFFGHDSGISHLAAAVGTSCLLLFGPTNPAVWTPANRRVRVVQAPRGDLSKLSIEEVARELRASRATS